MTLSSATITNLSEYQSETTSEYQSKKKYNLSGKNVFFRNIFVVWYDLFGLMTQGHRKDTGRAPKGTTGHQQVPQVSPNTLWRRVCLIQTIFESVNSFCVANLFLTGKERH